MKKSIILTIALAMALSLSACGESGGGSAEADVSVTASSNETVKDETTTPPETTAEETTTTEPAVKENPSTDFEFEEKDGEITITKFKGSGDEVIIPAEINGKPVTFIADKAFEKSKIKSVVIPEGVASITSSSFVDCRNLTDITFPESLTEIITDYQGYNGSCKPYVSFDGTPWLEAKISENPLVIVNNILIDGRNCSRSVEIPEGVTQIGTGAFFECTTVTSVSIPNSVKKISAVAFHSCERLAEIVLPDSVSFIGDYAFYNCNALENVTFPNNTVEMGTCIFDTYYFCCPWLESKRAEDPLVIVNGNLIDGTRCSGSVVVPDSVKSIAGAAFGYPNNDFRNYVTSVTLPNGITKIPDALFEYASNLTSVTIPDSITEIGDSAFNGCLSLKDITIPNGVTSIGSWAFGGTPIENITIPENVTEIGDSCFSWCERLKSVTLSEGLKKIGSQAFAYSRLTELTLPDSIESISEDTFKECKIDVTYKGEVYFPELYDELFAAINDN